VAGSRVDPVDVKTRHASVESPIRVFESIDALETHLADSLRNMELDYQRVRSIIAWPWIISSLTK